MSDNRIKDKNEVLEKIETLAHDVEFNKEWDLEFLRRRFRQIHFLAHMALYGATLQEINLEEIK